MTAAPPPPGPAYKHSRLNRVAAWVGIVAGVVFIVAVIFGTGVIVGKHSGGPRGGFERHHERAILHRMGPPPMFPMGPMGPAFGGRGGQPGEPGMQPPGQPGQPGQPPTATVTPAPGRPN